MLAFVCNLFMKKKKINKHADIFILGYIKESTFSREKKSMN